MKTKRLFFLLFFSLISIIKLNAQEICGTPPPTTQYQYETLKTNNSSYDQSVCINVYFHIVRNTNGTGGYNSSQLHLIINNLNQFYNPFGIYFNNIGFEYIDNSEFVQVSENESSTLASINNQANAINYYIVDSLWNTEYGFVTGTALSIPSNRLIIRQDRVTSSTSPHEIGHCLNLLHTFETATCLEAINGSNCTTCGDMICDTPADANIGTTGGYSPDMTNIMSYYSNRDHFTSEQIIRAKTAIINNPLLQQVISTGCLYPEMVGSEAICNNSSTTYTVINGGNNVIWNVSSNLTILSSTPTSITIQPITPTTTGSAFVKAILPTLTLQKNIWIGIPEGVISRTTEYCEGKYHYITFEVNPYINVDYEWAYVNYPGAWYTEANNKLYVKLPSTFSSSLFDLSVTMTNLCGTGYTFYEEAVKKCGTFTNQQEMNSINVYPNPANESLEIQIEEETSEDTSKEITVQILDLQLNKIYEEKRKSSAKIQIDTRNIKEGYYILVVSDATKKYSTQVIIKH
jgi:hypothetical protein